MPAKRARTQPKGATKAKSKGQVKDVLKSDSVAHALQTSEDLSTRKRRQLNRRDSDEKAARTVHKAFPTTPKMELKRTKVDGVTIYQRVLRELRSGSCERVSKYRMSELAAPFQFSSSMDFDVVVKKKDELVGDDLRIGLEVAADTNSSSRSAGPLLSSLRVRMDINQREVAGVLLSLPALQKLATAQATLDKIMLELLQCVYRYWNSNVKVFLHDDMWGVRAALSSGTCGFLLFINFLLHSVS